MGQNTPAALAVSSNTAPPLDLSSIDPAIRDATRKLATKKAGQCKRSSPTPGRVTCGAIAFDHGQAMEASAKLPVIPGPVVKLRLIHQPKT
jgi:hypothetical protein